MKSRTSPGWANALACGLVFSTMAGPALAANPFDDFAKGIGDAVRKKAEEAINAIDVSGLSATPGQGSSNPAPATSGPAPAKANPAPGKSNPAPAKSNPAAHVSGTQRFRCLDVGPANDMNYPIKNTCSDPIIAIAASPLGGPCTWAQYSSGKGTRLNKALRIVATCRKPPQGAMQIGTCECPAGTEITATSSTSPVAAPPKPSPDPNDYPSTISGCPVRADDPRWKTMSKGSHCNR